MNPAGSFNPPAGFNQDVGLGWEYLRLINCSPYQLQVSLGGQGSKTHPEMFFEDIPLTRAFNGKVVVTPVAQMNAGSISNALTNYVQLEVYGLDEIRHPQAQPLTTLAAVGGGGLTSPIPPIVLLVDTTGLSQDCIDFTDKRVGAHEIQLQKGHPSMAAPEGMLFVDITAGNLVPLAIATTGNTMDNGAMGTDGAGDWKAVSYITITGKQETGLCAAFDSNARNGGVIGQGVNFKTVMTNVPSSVTLSGITHNNCGTESASNITKYGFLFEAICTSSAVNANSAAQYVTVGN